MKPVISVVISVAIAVASYFLLFDRNDFIVPAPDADSRAPFEVPPPVKASILAIPLEANLANMLEEAKAGIANPVAQGSEVVNVPTRVHLQLFATRTVRKEVEKLESKTVEETRRECARSERRCARFERRVEKICRDVPWPLNEICDVVDSAVCMAYDTTCVAWTTVVIGTRVIQVPITVMEEVEEEFVELIDQVTDLDAELDYTINFVDLDAELDGTTLRGVVDVDYKIKLNARLNALGGKIKLAEVNGLTSCGYDEPMRRLRMRFSADVATLDGAALALGTPSWSLEWPNACQLTAFDVQLEYLLNLPLVEAAVKTAVDKALEKARTKANGNLRFQDRIAEIWPDIHRPIELGDTGWIAINPESVLIAPISGEGTTARTIATIVAHPVISDSKPTPIGPSTAPLARIDNRTPGIALGVAIGISHAAASTQIADALADMAPEFMSISEVRTYSSLGRLVVGVQLEAPVRGMVYLIGNPVLVSDAQISFPDIDYSIASSNALIEVVDRLFHDKLRDTLRDAAVLDFTVERDSVLKAYREREVDLGEDGKLMLSLDSVAMNDLWVMNEGVYALLTLEGAANVSVNP